MNGIGFVLSKACCPFSNLCTSKKINVCRSNKISVCRSSKINFGSSNKIDVIPCRLSNLHHQRMSHSVATNAMLKHRVNASSAGKDVKGSRFELPRVSSAVVPYVLLGVGIIGMALGTARGVVAQILSTRGGIQGFSKPNACSYVIILGVTAVYLARGFLGNIICGFTVLHNKPFSVGDMIEVGQLKGRVIEMGPITASLCTAESHCTVVPMSWLNGQAIVNKSRAPSQAIESEIGVNINELEKIPEITEEIRNMMRSNSIVYLEQEQPYCYLSGVEPFRAKLSIGWNIKQLSGEERSSGYRAIMMQSLQIIKKHGAELGERM